MIIIITNVQSKRSIGKDQTKQKRKIITQKHVRRCPTPLPPNRQQPRHRKENLLPRTHGLQTLGGTHQLHRSHLQTQKGKQQPRNPSPQARVRKQPTQKQPSVFGSEEEQFAEKVILPQQHPLEREEGGEVGKGERALDDKEGRAGPIEINLFNGSRVDCLADKEVADINNPKKEGIQFQGAKGVKQANTDRQQVLEGPRSAVKIVY